MTGMSTPPTPHRREFHQSAAGALLAGVLTGTMAAPLQARETKPKQFRLWAMGDSHVGTDMLRKRESLAEAIRHSEHGGPNGAPAFDWDIALHVGDLSGGQGPPDDHEGHEVVRQYGALTNHRREDVYDLAGNHDATRFDEPTQWWFRKWVDPTGENTQHSGIDASRRRYAIEGTWERYSFRVGNLLFLVMSDRNDLKPPVGRGASGGYPSGAVTGETFDWWKQQVENKRDAIVLTAHHHMLCETTVASGPWEGYVRNQQGEWQSHYHGYFADGGPEGASYLYFVDEKPDARAFEGYLARHPAATDMWFGGHTHTHPDDNHGGRTHIERKWGTHFINCAALTRYHGKTSMPMSRLLTFTEGSPQVKVQCYLHSNQHAPIGWYAKAERIIELPRPFSFTV